MPQLLCSGSKHPSLALQQRLNCPVGRSTPPGHSQVGRSLFSSPQHESHPHTQHAFAHTVPHTSRSHPPPSSSPTSHTKEPETLFTAILSKCAHYFIHACEARAGIPVQHIRKLGHPDCSSYPDKGTGEDWAGVRTLRGAGCGRLPSH